MFDFGGLLRFESDKINGFRDGLFILNAMLNGAQPQILVNGQLLKRCWAFNHSSIRLSAC